MVNPIWVFFLFPNVFSMQIVENKALVFVTKKADQITALLPKCKVLATQGELSKMIVHWGIDEWRILKNIGIKDVPHPILGQYEWPGVYTPFAHQRTTAEFLVAHQRAYCLSDPGTGKTSAATWAADYLMDRGIIKRALVVCPLSIMDTAWRADIFKTAMHRRVAIATGSRKQRAAVIAQNADFTIINFDGVGTVMKELIDAQFDLIIIDEATFIKNASSDRWKALASLVRPTTWVWSMTGTPAAQSPEDAYGIAKLTRPDSVPRYAGAWRDQVMTKITQFKWVPKSDAQSKVYNLLQPAIRFTKEECLDLPGILHTARSVPMTAQQAKYYELVRKQMATAAAGEEITAVNAASLLSKLLQISSGTVYSDTKEVVQFDIKTRFKELLSIIEGTSHKTLVFVPFRHATSVLTEMLTAHFGNANAVGVIAGGVSASARVQIITQFQNEEWPKVILAQPQAAGHGITLTRADQVVWWGPTPSAELYLQGNARAYRAGQKNKVTVTHIYSSQVEKRMFDMLQNKVDMHQGLVELYKQTAEGDD